MFEYNSTQIGKRKIYREAKFFYKLAKICNIKIDFSTLLLKVVFGQKVDLLVWKIAIVIKLDKYHYQVPSAYDDLMFYYIFAYLGNIGQKCKKSLQIS